MPDIEFNDIKPPAKRDNNVKLQSLCLAQPLKNQLKKFQIKNPMKWLLWLITQDLIMQKQPLVILVETNSTKT